jgi:hypothetical protein
VPLAASKKSLTHSVLDDGKNGLGS